MAPLGKIVKCTDLRNAKICTNFSGNGAASQKIGRLMQCHNSEGRTFGAKELGTKDRHFFRGIVSFLHAQLWSHRQRRIQTSHITYARRNQLQLVGYWIAAKNRPSPLE